RDDGAGARRQDVGDRRALRGDQGDAGRLHRDRGARPERGGADRRARSVCPRRPRRGAPRGRLQPAAPQAVSSETRIALEHAYRTEARRVLATLIRLLGGFEAAEEALHEAFAAAAKQWPRDGVPDNPYAWLVSAGRFRIIDRWRRNARLADALPELAALCDPAPEPDLPQTIEDDELRLIFLCCHPALPADGRIALTLREVGGLTTEEIARAYLAPAPTIAQRIVRAKAKLRDEAVPYEVPGRAELPARLESVLLVVYLIFNEGYAATGGAHLTRADLCAEAIRLGRLIVDLLDEPEAQGLLALMLLHEARRAARVDAV